MVEINIRQVLCAEHSLRLSLLAELYYINKMQGMEYIIIITGGICMVSQRLYVSFLINHFTIINTRINSYYGFNKCNFYFPYTIMYEWGMWK